MSRALIAKQPRFIKWPSTNDECSTIKNEFYLRGGFPCVIRCVDETHVRLQAPSQHENNYVNRKGFIPSMCKVCNHGVKASIVQRIVNFTSFKIKLISPSDKFLSPREVLLYAVSFLSRYNRYSAKAFTDGKSCTLINETSEAFCS